MHSLLLEWREQLQSLPLWQRALYITVIYLLAVTVVSLTHGLIAAVLSTSTALAFGYLIAKQDVDPLKRPRAFIDIHRPSQSHIKLAAAAILAIVGIEVTLGVVHSLVSPNSTVASHSIASAATAEPSAARIALLALAAVVVGPFIEELVFRNGIQKTLNSFVGAPLAIGLTSAIFSVLHVPSYGGFDAPATALSLPLVAIFASSCIFGTVYHRTENVLAAYLTHGGMNALALLAILT